MANAINTVFAGYDKLILSVLHFLSRFLGFLLTPLAKLVTFLGERALSFSCWRWCSCVVQRPVRPAYVFSVRCAAAH